MSEDGRRRHYGVFYGLEELPPADRPRLLVHGNCQAEALRVALSTSQAVHGVRVPPVHELEPEDLPHLERVLRWADVLVAQAVRDDYRGLPLGTAQVAGALRDPARVVRVPNYFSTVLYPEQVLVRADHPDVVDPPVVPYHDVRRLGRAAGWHGPPETPAQAVRDRAAASLAELRRREQEQGSLVVSDVVAEAGAEAGWTVDHPGNPVLLALAGRVLDVVVGPGVAVHDPGRVLLGGVRTPLRAHVLDALGLEGEPRAGWLVEGRELSDQEVGEAHLRFYAERPAVVETAVAGKEQVLRGLGWAP